MNYIPIDLNCWHDLAIRAAIARIAVRQFRKSEIKGLGISLVLLDLHKITRQLIALTCGDTISENRCSEDTAATNDLAEMKNGYASSIRSVSIEIVIQQREWVETLDLQLVGIMVESDDAFIQFNYV